MSLPFQRTAEAYSNLATMACEHLKPVLLTLYNHPMAPRTHVDTALYATTEASSHTPLNISVDPEANNACIDGHAPSSIGGREDLYPPLLSPGPAYAAIILPTATQSTSQTTCIALGAPQKLIITAEATPTVNALHTQNVSRSSDDTHAVRLQKLLVRVCARVIYSSFADIERRSRPFAYTIEGRQR
jgi:hypothetical protein